MDLLVRYGEALGAERFVDATNIAGVPGSSTLFLHNYYKEHGGGSFEDVFSRFDLDSDEIVTVPEGRRQLLPPARRHGSRICGPSRA